MNKLITTNNGGYPFVLDDLRFVDDSVRDALKNTFRIYGGTNNQSGFIIDLDLDINNVYGAGQQFPETAVFMNNEIWTLPAFTFPNPGAGSLYLWISSDIGFTNSAPGLKVLQNGTSVNSYQTRKATTYLSNVAGGSGMESTFPAFVYDFNEGGWISIANSNLKYLMNQKTGLNTQIAGLSSLNSAYQSTVTTVNSHETRLDAIDAPWTTITGNALKSAIGWRLGSGGYTSPAVYASPIGTFNTTNSFVKYKIIGKTMFVNMNIDALIIPSVNINTSNPLVPIVNQSSVVTALTFDFYDLNNLGLTIDNQVSGTVNVGERNMPSPSGSIAYFFAQGSNGIEFRMNNGNEESGVAWNYYYTDTVVSGQSYIYRKGSGAPWTSNTSPATYSLRGSFQIELN